jgi:hypothetical protein
MPSASHRTSSQSCLRCRNHAEGGVSLARPLLLLYVQRQWSGRLARLLPREWKREAAPRDVRHRGPGLDSP